MTYRQRLGHRTMTYEVFSNGKVRCVEREKELVVQTKIVSVEKAREMWKNLQKQGAKKF